MTYLSGSLRGAISFQYTRKRLPYSWWYRCTWLRTCKYSMYPFLLILYCNLRWGGSFTITRGVSYTSLAYHDTINIFITILLLVLLLSWIVCAQVMDIAEGHVAALRYLSALDTSPSATVGNSSHHWTVFNLGSGIGRSVLELLSSMEKVCHNSILHP